MHGSSGTMTATGSMGPLRDEPLNRDDSLSSSGGGGGGVVGHGDQRRYTERRKKTVRFDRQDSQNQPPGFEEWSRWDSERQGSQDSTTKDSGIDTSSTFTSSEDSNRGDGPKVYTQRFSD